MRVKIELLSLFTVYLSINGRILYRNILLQCIQTEHEFWSVVQSSNKRGTLKGQG